MSSLSSTKRRLAALLTPSTVALLDSQGYCVIDNAVPSHLAHGLRSEILSCYDAGLMNSNHTAYVAAPPLPPSSPHPTPLSPTSSSPASPLSLPHITHLYSKPNIYEAEILPSLLTSPPHPLPHLTALTTSLLPYLDSLLSSLLPSLLLYSGHSSIKIQLNRGGSFPFHLDSPGNAKDTRRLTFLLYLNPHYQPSQGGALILQPFLSTPIAIQPLFNRVVLFYSHHMLHRVGPVGEAEGGGRVCLTVWLHGRSVDPPMGEDWWGHVGVQRGLSKCVYEEEWRGSYREAHGGAGGERLGESLAGDVQRMMGDEGVRGVVEWMKGIKRQCDSQPMRVIGEGEADVTGGQEEDNGEGDEGGERQTGEKEVVVRDVGVEEMGFLDFL